MLKEKEIQELVTELKELKKKYPYKFYELKGILKGITASRTGKEIE